MNPCPCGNYLEKQKPCTCAHAVVTRLQKRISDPILDRSGIHLEVPRVDYEKLSDDRWQSPPNVCANAFKLHGRQTKRFSNNGSSDIVCNA